MSSNRRDRSRSPTRSSHVGRRRDKKPLLELKNGDMPSSNANLNSNSNMMNPMVMQNMFTQGNMLMGYSNMMMPNSMMGGTMLPNSGMDMMPNTGMEMMTQSPMDIQTMPSQQMQTQSSGMDMGMMSGMMMDPGMMGMYSAMTGMGNEMQPVMEKKEIILKHCKLTPPSPGTPEPPRRAKPPGCRTIFVGGLPEKIRESHVREIFECYGRIHTLRLSNKNFCHIRFDRENCVEAAIFLSGYQIKLLSGKEEEDKDETKATTSWLHVDYALSRDDQNEHDRRQRQVMRAQEEQMKQLSAQQKALVSSQRVEPDYRRSPSPVRIQPFTNAAIVQLSDKIKSEEFFSVSLPTLIAWLERGECSKKNSTQFYSMIQATNSHIRRLFNEKMQAEDELNNCKERVKTHIEGVIEQLEQVAKVFLAATHQRVWDHFTKPQRKNIETWQKMSQEFNALREEFIERFESEDNEFANYNAIRSNEQTNDEIHNLKRENESLQFQLEAYKNEVDVIKADAQKEMEKFKAQFIARQALKGNFDLNPPLPEPVAKPPPPPPLPSDIEMSTKVNIKNKLETGCGEAKLIGVISAFLQVHPQGASLDYVVSYVRAVFPHVTQATVHHVLQRHADVFECTTSGCGANIEHRWFFIAFRKE